jgi:hypothetical protein
MLLVVIIFVAGTPEMYVRFCRAPVPGAELVVLRDGLKSEPTKHSQSDVGFAIGWKPLFTAISIVFNFNESFS